MGIFFWKFIGQVIHRKKYFDQIADHQVIYLNCNRKKYADTSARVRLVICSDSFFNFYAMSYYKSIFIHCIIVPKAAEIINFFKEHALINILFQAK